MTTKTTAEILDELLSNTPVDLAKPHLPAESGLYGLFDPFGVMRYVGQTQNIRRRILNYHITGTETYSHKFAAELNQHAFYVDRTTLTTDRPRASIVRALRQRFIRQHYRATFVPIPGTDAELRAIEADVKALAKPENVLWNDRTTPATRITGPIAGLLIDFMKTEIRTTAQRTALQTQAALWRKAVGI